MLNYSAEAPLGTSKSGDGIDQSSMSEIHTAVIESAKLTPPSTTHAIKPALLAIKLSGLIYDASILKRASTALNNSSEVARGGRIPSSVLFPQSPELTSEDHELLDKLYDGLRKVAAEAQQQGVRLLVDAEQSWFQPAIDRYCDLLSEEFNRAPNAASTSSTPYAPIVYNTYQCYRRDTPSKIAAQLAHADANNYGFGAKLVRGAYQESERKIHSDTPAFAAGEPCVVWDSKAETDKCYDQCAAMLEKRLVEDLKQKKASAPGVGVCLASHNGTSMKLFLEELRRDGLAKEKDGGLEVDERLRGRVAFGQLMGACPLSFPPLTSY
jgi:proline dehydrogenase